LTFIIAAAIVFVIVRFFASRYVVPAATINSIGTVLVVVICAGALIRGAFFGERAPAPTVAPQWPAAQSGAGVAPPAIAAAAASAASPAAGHAPVAPGNALGAIDTLTASGDGPAAAPGTFTAGSTLYATGWAASHAKKPYTRLIFLIDRRVAVEVKASPVSRPDVAKAFATPAMSATGFQSVAIPTAGLAKGTHSLQVGGTLGGVKREVAPGALAFTLQ
jgi:hypothetical protein